jgi:hypothetical protein
MSYCRFSSDDFHCDLYCYESTGGGWMTHVAESKLIGEAPKTDHLSIEDTIVIWDAHRQKIGLPLDGQTFHDTTLEEFRARLLTLRAAGYRFPDNVLERIEDEIRERKS